MKKKKEIKTMSIKNSNTGSDQWSVIIGDEALKRNALCIHLFTLKKKEKKTNKTSIISSSRKPAVESIFLCRFRVLSISNGQAARADSNKKPNLTQIGMFQ